MIAIYEIMMMMVQIVLLNLLIAIMSDSHARVAENSLLVAQFERAKMILEHERLMFKKDAPIAPPTRRSTRSSTRPTCAAAGTAGSCRSSASRARPTSSRAGSTCSRHVDERRAVGEHAALRAQIDDVRGAVDASAAEFRKNFDSQLEKPSRRSTRRSRPSPPSTPQGAAAAAGLDVAPAAPQGERVEPAGRRSLSPPHPGWSRAARSAAAQSTAR